LAKVAPEDVAETEGLIIIAALAAAEEEEVLEVASVAQAAKG
jgi:hypothetical protein